MQPTLTATCRKGLGHGCRRRHLAASFAKPRSALSSFNNSFGGVVAQLGSCGVSPQRERSRFFSSGSAKAPLVICLDLDETLVRVCCEGVHKNRTLDRADFQVGIDVGLQRYDCGVSLRPGLVEFLQWLQDRRDAGLIEGPWIFTTAMPVLTKAILRKIDPGGQVFAMRVLTREVCSRSRMPGFFLKDLARVPSTNGDSDVQRKVLVDNSAISCVLNPRSAIIVRDWLGDKPEDNELARVQKMLDAVIDETHRSDPDAVDYLAQLETAMPGQRALHVELEALGARLENEPPAKELLRGALREISAESHEIKRRLLGAAP